MMMIVMIDVMVGGVDVYLYAICEDDDAVFDRKDGADVCCDYADYGDLVDEQSNTRP